MPLSWNEIKQRAIQFSTEWENTSNEEADAKPFLEAFFDVFGITRKRVSTFEHRVKKIDDSDGYIDLLWKGNILVEMKSRGRSLDRAYSQAVEYTYGLKEHELPKYILVSDFERFRLYNLDNSDDALVEFLLKDLVSNVHHFGYLLGYQKKVYKEQDPANVKAAELMGKLHDRLMEIGYTGHPLEVYLVRVLFCLFAEDTTIFTKQQFQDYIEQRTADDGSDLAARLQELFQVLNTPHAQRFKNLDEQLADFPHINGRLFEEQLPIASFDSRMRQALLSCTRIDWSRISPAIFGSMFQSVMNPKERRNLGAHYTSEQNILKLIKPLFLDELWAEFEKIKGISTSSMQVKRLNEFHKKLSTLTFLDPACGCGNFLVITYRELRLLELEILRALNKSGQQVIDVSSIIRLDVDQFYGIEFEEFPARIAEVAMWLIDHQMNLLISNEFGQYFVRLPLKKSATIVHADALETNWQTLLNPVNTFTVYANHANIIVNEPTTPYGTVNVFTKTVSHRTKDEINNEQAINEKRFDYIFGNPPFIGSKLMSAGQRSQIANQFNNAAGSGVLDYVTGWYIKAANHIQGSRTKVAFVSTNSIVQGEQTAILWKPLIENLGIKIHFAHRTFKWSNEGRGVAAVYCVIIGFANFDTTNKLIYDYDDIRGEAHEIKASNINPYLVDAKDVFVEKRREALCEVPRIVFGSMPNDGGFLLLSNEEKEAICEIDKIFAKYVRPFIGAYEFLNGIPKWCLWLETYEPSDIRKSKYLTNKLEMVQKYRLASSRATTQKLAKTPYLFGEIRQPKTDYILMPRVSSENRTYIPMGFFSADSIAGDTCAVVPNASLYHFGVLMSAMHMAWVKSVCGRLKSDFRYSNEIVYNNFPWAENVAEKQIGSIEKSAQNVIDARRQFPESTLADLYNPVAMPTALSKAHIELDHAVDLAYRPQPFKNDAERLEFLLGLYEELIEK